MTMRDCRSWISGPRSLNSIDFPESGPHSKRFFSFTCELKKGRWCKIGVSLETFWTNSGSAVIKIVGARSGFQTGLLSKY